MDQRSDQKSIMSVRIALVCRQAWLRPTFKAYPLEVVAVENPVPIAAHVESGIDEANGGDER